MFNRKKLWITPVIVAIAALIIAAAGVFAAPGSVPGVEQNGITLAQEGKTFRSSKDLPPGTCYAIVNGEFTPVKQGMTLDLDNVEGPVVLGGKGNDYYNHAEIGTTYINGKLVILKAEMIHIDPASQQRRYHDWLKKNEAAGLIIGDHAKSGHLVSAEQEVPERTEYEGYARTTLYRDSTWQTFVQSTLDYWDNGEEVGGTDYHCPYGHRLEYTLDDYDCSWYPGPDDRIWSYHRCEFSDGFDHASAARYVAWKMGPSWLHLP